MKYLLPIVLLALLVFVSQVSLVGAGGGNIMLTPLNMGLAKEKPVELVVTIFEPSKNKLDWPELDKYAKDVTGYEAVGVTDLELEFKFENPQSNQYCTIKDSNKTNAYGQVRALCYSDVMGAFIVEAIIKTDKPLYEGGPNANGTIRGVSINFDKKIHSSPAPQPTRSPSPSPVPSPTPQSSGPAVIDPETDARLTEFEQQNEEQKQQIDALKSKLETQEKEMSAMKKMMNQIQSFFRRFFR